MDRYRCPYRSSWRNMDWNSFSHSLQCWSKNHSCCNRMHFPSIQCSKIYLQPQLCPEKNWQHWGSLRCSPSRYWGSLQARTVRRDGKGRKGEGKWKAGKLEQGHRHAKAGPGHVLQESTNDTRVSSFRHLLSFCIGPLPLHLPFPRYSFLPALSLLPSLPCP